ncbi:MAG: M48 family metallopeptidase [Lachnospiraceae bacterium]|nr:M48 family metallopeptidase [Lachnospiraceae bacterium]
MNYRVEIIRSKRRSLGLEIREPGLVTVRAPFGLSEKRIQRFLEEKELWLYENLERIARNRDEKNGAQTLSKEEIKTLAKEATEKLPPIVEKWANIMGVTYGRITIRHQKTRWGSCSSAGNLNFNCLLMLAPDEVQQYVVIHELAHRIEMNHSKAFWNIVKEYDPEYEAHKLWLKNEGVKFRVE